MRASRTVCLSIRCVAIGCLTILAACGGDTEHEIDDVRRGRTVARGERARMSHGERFGQAAPAAFTYDLPAGWKAEQLPPGSMRKVSLKTAGKAPAVVAVFLLPASPVIDNVNRWCRQLGASPASAEDLASMAYDWRGTPATLVDLSGTHQGMSGKPAQNQRFLGMLAPFRGQMLSVKLVGDVAEVNANEAAFGEFLQSLQYTRGGKAPSGGHTMGTDGGSGHAAGSAGHSGGAQPPSTGSDLGSKLRWDVPTGWSSETVSGNIRLATFRVEIAAELDVRLSALKGAGGGLVETTRMWARSVRADEPSTKDLAAFQRLPILGSEAVIVELTGKPTPSVKGGDPVERGLLGLYLPLEEHSLFLVVVGRASDVALQRAAFLELSKSFRIKE